MEFALIFMYVGIPVGLLVLGLVAGRIAEKRHYQSIRERERQFVQIPAITTGDVAPDKSVREVKLVIGSVVVSIDHFKRFLSGFRMFFGGEMGSLSPLIDRGRREAMLRMKGSAPDADMYINCRFTTSTISSGAQNQLGTVEVMAFATAVYFDDKVPYREPA